MMTRSLYQAVVYIHPPAFRRRFRDEMMSIFDETQSLQCVSRPSGSSLLFDCLLSFARQWLLRTNAWKVLVAIAGGSIQVLSLVLPMKGHQNWVENSQAVSPYMQEMILLTLAVVCSLTVMIFSLALWTARFHSRRSKERWMHPARPVMMRLGARE